MPDTTTLGTQGNFDTEASARSSMAWLIAHLRIMINDTDEDVWTDLALQNYLDMHSNIISREKLFKDPEERVFSSQNRTFEGATSASTVPTGTSSTWTGAGDATDVINIWDSSGNDATVITPDNYNLASGVFTFSTDQDGKIYYLDARWYDLHAVIADCMEQLAMNPQKAKQWERGGVSYTHYDYMDMAEYHRKLTGGRGRLL